MKKILVPTDFSANARNAVRYAALLAKKTGAELILLHVYPVQAGTPGYRDSALEDELMEGEQESHKLLEAERLSLIEKSKLKCVTESEPGDTVSGILGKILKYKPDLVVMGSKGATGAAAVIFGGNTLKVIEKTKCPVLVVPSKASFEGFQKICYATDFHKPDLQNLEHLISLTADLKAKIEVIHVAEQSQDKAQANLLRFMDTLGRGLIYRHLSAKVLSGESPEKILHNYLRENKCDLLVMTLHKQALFTKFFGKNMTRKMVYHTSIPLLVFRS